MDAHRVYPIIPHTICLSVDRSESASKCIVCQVVASVDNASTIVLLDVASPCCTHVDHGTHVVHLNCDSIDSFEELDHACEEFDAMPGGCGVVACTTQTSRHAGVFLCTYLSTRYACAVDDCIQYLREVSDVDWNMPKELLARIVDVSSAKPVRNRASVIGERRYMYGETYACLCFGGTYLPQLSTVRSIGGVLSYPSRSREGDTIVATHMKSGTTWMLHLLYQVVSDGDLTFPNITAVTPWLEDPGMYATEELCCITPSCQNDTGSRRRVIKTHLPVHLLRLPHCKGKCVFIVRHPSDVASSTYRHNCRSHESFMLFDDFFEGWFEGKGLYGDWFEHTRNWLAAARRYPEKVIVVRYEDLCASPDEEYRRIVEYFGLDVACLERWQHRASISWMREHASLFDYSWIPYMKRKEEEQSFFGVGRPGAGRVHLSTEQNSRVQEKYEQEFSSADRDVLNYFQE